MEDNTNTQTTEPQGEPEGDNSEEMAKLKALVKEREQEINRLKNEKLTEDQRRQAELEQREADIARREEESKARDNKYHATQALADSGILVDGITTKDVLPFVMGADETEIDKRVKSLAAVIGKVQKATTDKLYRENGRDPRRVGKGDCSDFIDSVNYFVVENMYSPYFIYILWYSVDTCGTKWYTTLSACNFG